MKILEIEGGKGFFRTSEETMSEIDKIDKDGLMTLLELFLRNDVEMDPPDQEKLQNQAQQIVYKSIFDKLYALKDSKSKFKDESERKYLKEIKKYKAKIDLAEETGM